MKIIRNMLSVVVTASAIPALATELIANGGFESGDFSGWVSTVNTLFPDLPGDLTVESGTTGPFSGLSNAGPSAGGYFALADQSGPGAYSLAQTFTVPVAARSVILKFDMFANSYADVVIDPLGLNPGARRNQHARVDLLSATAGAFDTFTGVIENFYLGADAGANPNPWTSYTVDLTGLADAGGTYQIRFAMVTTLNYFNLGVDNVSVTSVPEPGAAGLMLAGLAALALATGVGRSPPPVA